MNPPSPNDLLAQLRVHRLLSEEQLRAVTVELLPRYTDAKSIVRELLQRNWLTPHQANRLLQGRAAELAPAVPSPPAETLIPKRTIEDSGIRWKLGAILAGVFLVVFVIVLLNRPKKKDPIRPPDEDGGTQTSEAWPEDMSPLKGTTRSSREGVKFVAENVNGETTVRLEGHYVLSEVIIDRILVRGSERSTYTDMDDMRPGPPRRVAQTLRELGRREVFGQWKR